MDINLKEAKKMQKLTGWGTSACWWSHYCKDEKTQDKIVGLLYGDDGLKLNIYRYNIGAGFDEHNCRIENEWRKTQSFMNFDSESGSRTWDFSKDKTAVDVMKKALASGNVDTLVLFCNSPHYSFTSTGQSSGSLIESTCNIPKMNYQRFADYVLDIAEHFIKEGLPVKYISPINEPQWKWGGKSVWQEGCHYECEELCEILHIFAEKIKKRGLDLMLYSPESGCMLENTYDYIKAMSDDKEIMSATDVFAYHSYHSDNSVDDRIKFKRDFVEKFPDIRFDMSEWCELPCLSHTADFKGALITARIIGRDIIYGGASSWTSWVAVNQSAVRNEDGFDHSDGLISAESDFSEWYIAKRYYALAHFSKYVPSGSYALDINYTVKNGDLLNVFAFSALSGETVLVIVNEGKDAEININGDFGEMSIIRSTQNENLKKIYSGVFNSEIKAVSESIQTVILK